jgi:hypothetical protein
MRWFLAGCSFAMLVALAVFTVAMRAANVRSRALLELVTRDVHVRHVELARRQFDARMELRREALALRWQQVSIKPFVAE